MSNQSDTVTVIECAISHNNDAMMIADELDGQGELYIAMSVKIQGNDDVESRTMENQCGVYLNNEAMILLRDKLNGLIEVPITTPPLVARTHKSN